MNKNVLHSFSRELTKLAIPFAPLVGDVLSPMAKSLASKKPSFGNFIPRAMNKFKQGASTMFHGANPTINPKTGKPPLTPGWKKASNISKGVLGGAGLAAGIAGAGTLWGGLTMDPSMNSSFSGEGPSAQGPVYGA